MRQTNAAGIRTTPSSIGCRDRTLVTHATSPSARTWAIVIFDSTVAESEAQAIYIEANAERVGDAEQAQAIEVVSHRSLAHGGEPWTTSDVSAPAAHHLYRATASTHFLLGADDRRMTVRLDR